MLEKTLSKREEIILANINEKKALLAILISDNTNLKAKSTVSCKAVSA